MVPQTRAAVAGRDSTAVAQAVVNRGEARLRAIVDADETQRKLLEGWLNRLNDLQPGRPRPSSTYCRRPRREGATEERGPDVTERPRGLRCGAPQGCSVSDQIPTATARLP